MNFLVARADKHFWEEPIISGDNGSGTIFFGGCTLRCVYCQNYQISHEVRAVSVTGVQLIYLMQYLEEKGVHNINLVTPSHYIKSLAKLLEKAKKVLKIPIVYNSGGYDNLGDLQALNGLIDVYLPDLKYYSGELSLKYSGKNNYFEVASKAIAEMRRQQPCDIIQNGVMRNGVIVRHLILPSCSADSLKVLSYLASLDKSLYVSLMSQYCPCGNLDGYPEINKRLKQKEYDKIREHFFEAGLSNGFMQDLDSAIEDYVPSFDLAKIRGEIAHAEKLYGR